MIPSPALLKVSLRTTSHDKARRSYEKIPRDRYLDRRSLGLGLRPRWGRTSVRPSVTQTEAAISGVPRPSCSAPTGTASSPSPMISEDFSLFLEETGGAFVLVGAAMPGTAALPGDEPLHPKRDRRLRRPREGVGKLLAEARHQAADLATNETTPRARTRSQAGLPRKGPAKKAAKAATKSRTKPRPARTLNNAKAEELLGRIIEIVRREDLLGSLSTTWPPSLGHQQSDARLLLRQQGRAPGPDRLRATRGPCHQLESGTGRHSPRRSTAGGEPLRHRRTRPTWSSSFTSPRAASREPEKFQEFSSTAVELWLSYFHRACAITSATPRRRRSRDPCWPPSRGLQGELLISADKAHVERSLKVFKQLLEEHLHRWRADASVVTPRRLTPSDHSPHVDVVAERDRDGDPQVASEPLGPKPTA